MSDERRRTAYRGGSKKTIFRCFCLMRLKRHIRMCLMLLQVLDDGRITDSQGRTVDFKNTILIMTSNIGSATFWMASMRTVRTSAGQQESETMVMNDLRAHFRPEF